MKFKHLKIGQSLAVGAPTIKNDHVGKFWVVTKPSKVSTLIDIMFEADVAYMLLQAKGGLKAEDIEGLYKSKREATTVAEKLLNAR